MVIKFFMHVPALISIYMYVCMYVCIFSQCVSHKSVSKKLIFMNLKVAKLALACSTHLGVWQLKCNPFSSQTFQAISNTSSGDL